MDGRAVVLELSAVELRNRLSNGALRATELAAACVARIAAQDHDVGAWAWYDADDVMRQAATLDAYRQTGRPLGPLHGLPVALKDVIDTARIPTENGTPIDAGRVPERDAAIVSRLRAAGAIIMGKTVTTELAFLTPGKTRNPANASHTPGGSSSGSAAAVAANMVPLAVGTQTAGSLIRPASFCGVTGFKPTFGAISRTGILLQSHSLDTVGVLARTVEDTALLAETLFGYDGQDKATEPAPFPRLLATAQSKVPVLPTFAFVRTPFWDRADAQTQAAFEELSGLLGDQCFEAEMPNAFAEAAGIREQIHFAEMAKCYYSYVHRGADQLSPAIMSAIDAGNATPVRDYIAALDWPDMLNGALDAIFQRCDAILTPAAPGPAPATLESTGDPIFNGIWTLCRTPTVTIPILQAENGMPMGVQLVGRRNNDGRLLRTAKWLADFATMNA